MLLAGPGRKAQGFDKPGAIDISGGGTTVSVTHPGTAMLFLPGMAPVGPFHLSDAAYGRLLALIYASPGTGNDDAPGPTGPAAVGSGDILNAAEFIGDFFTFQGEQSPDGSKKTVDLPVGGNRQIPVTHP